MDAFFLIAMGVALVTGLFSGFGGMLKKLTKRLPGKIAAIVFTYFMYGTVLNLPFVKDLLADFVSTIAGWDNFGGKILLIIRIDMIVFAVGLYLAVRILQKLAVSMIASIIEAKNPLFITFNRLGGALLSMACVFIMFLIFFQFTSWVGGSDGTMYEMLEGSKLGLDRLYLNNPLHSVTETAKLSLLGF